MLRWYIVSCTREDDRSFSARVTMAKAASVQQVQRVIPDALRRALQIDGSRYVLASDEDQPEDWPQPGDYPRAAAARRGVLAAGARRQLCVEAVREWEEDNLAPISDREQLTALSYSTALSERDRREAALADPQGAVDSLGRQYAQMGLTEVQLRVNSDGDVIGQGRLPDGTPTYIGPASGAGHF